MTTTTLIDLTGAADPALCGGKAAGLARLAAAGFPVPEGAVVPADAADEHLDSLAGQLAARFAGSALAVRSSGVAEDLADASFAGQYETVLDVAAEATALAAAIRTVRASASGDHVAVYGHGTATPMAVLVMPMLAPTAAGIAFTRDPVTGERVVVIEAVTGVADRLASGEATGERWTVGDTAECRDDRGVLTAEQATAVADLARRVETAEDMAQDIEWALTGNGAVLLQARPITTIDDVDPIPIDDEPPPGPWMWDSTHSRVPMTPLTGSVFTPAFPQGSRGLVEHYGAPFDHLDMRVIRGYVYIQVVPPAGKPGDKPPPAWLAKILFRLLPPMRRREATARKAFTERTDRILHAEWRDSIRPELEATFDEWWADDLTALDEAALSERFLAAIDRQRRTFGWNMITDPAYLVPLADLHEIVTGLGEGMETVTRLLAGSSPSEYAASLRDLEQCLTPEVRQAILAADGDIVTRLDTVDPTFAAAYRDHLRRFGARILGFDLDVVTLGEAPAAELARLVTLPPENDPSEDAAALAAELRTRVPDDARFDAVLAEARATYPIREEGEAFHAKVMGWVRLAALEIGRRMATSGHLDDPEHVVFCTIDEVTGWLADPSDLRDPVRTRRGQRLWARSHTPPAFIGGEEEPIDLSIFPPNIRKVMTIYSLVIAHDSVPAELAEGADGVAASPGIHTGPVRIVHDVADFARVHPGDVLVAPITTSPWEVLFPTIGALVTEGGGLLSHPAIVAREYRLPAVVGCEGATTRFHDGQLVTVDGAAGTVTPVEDS